jgi:hypothetical protein
MLPRSLAYEASEMTTFSTPLLFRIGTPSLLPDSLGFGRVWIVRQQGSYSSTIGYSIYRSRLVPPDTERNPGMPILKSCAFLLTA